METDRLVELLYQITSGCIVGNVGSSVFGAGSVSPKGKIKDIKHISTIRFGVNTQRA